MNRTLNRMSNKLLKEMWAGIPVAAAGDWVIFHNEA